MHPPETIKSRRRIGSILRKTKSKVSELEADNKKIRKEIAVSGLNKMQVALIHESADDIAKHVDGRYLLDWRDLLFEVLLGTGSVSQFYCAGRRAQRRTCAPAVAEFPGSALLCFVCSSHKREKARLTTETTSHAIFAALLLARVRSLETATKARCRASRWR